MAQICNKNGKEMMVKTSKELYTIDKKKKKRQTSNEMEGRNEKHNGDGAIEEEEWRD